MRQITIAEAIQRTVEHREVFHDEMLHVMRQIMRGELSPAQIAGFIIGLSQGWGLERCGLLGTAASGLVIQGLGSDAGIVDLQHTLDFMNTAEPRPVD